MRSTVRDLQGFAVLVLALGLVGFILLRNNPQPVSGGDVQAAATETPAPDLPTLPVTATLRDRSWEQVVQGDLVNGATPLPTPSDTPPGPAATPTLDPALGGPVVWASTPTPTRFVPQPRTTELAPTAVAVESLGPAIRPNNNPRRGEFSPPPEQVPLSLDPRDHFWFTRPVDSSANSSEIYWYVYGSDGPENEWRVHHGVDLPNTVGQDVYAAGPGRVIWAADNYIWVENGRRVESAYTYGNVVIIEHDFGYEGQRLYTLYAHLSVILVEVNQRVNTGDIIGLSGRSGVVSGPHVHFEVRLGNNNYYQTRNPILWMAPYRGHGVVAGRVVRENGQPVQDVTVTLYQNGRVVDTTTTYVEARWFAGQARWHV
ncbi:MAG: peptidoglycan DD-metalloendopeptidase family protein, partial [Anaerolineae bacterium]|nr:peptidoglycan DD-metalloendopeptidase family protein [Anaerolineae bacterium]